MSEALIGNMYDIMFMGNLGFILVVFTKSFYVSTENGTTNYKTKSSEGSEERILS